MRAAEENAFGDADRSLPTGELIYGKASVGLALLLGSPCNLVTKTGHGGVSSEKH